MLTILIMKVYIKEYVKTLNNIKEKSLMKRNIKSESDARIYITKSMLGVVGNLRTNINGKVKKLTKQIIKDSHKTK